MGKKSFEAGMAAGVKPVGEKLDQLGQEIEVVHSEQKEVKDKVTILIEDLETRNKLRLLGLENYHDLTELEESEKVILMSLMHWLAKHNIPSECQQKYLSFLGRYIGIFAVKEDISPVDVLQNISDTDVHKVFLRTVLEYIYLGSQDWAFDDIEQEVVEAFEIGPRTMGNIKKGIEGEFKILGIDGLTQKYDIRETPKEEEPLPPGTEEESETSRLEALVDFDTGITDNKDPVRPFHQLISVIQEYTATAALGKPLLGEKTDEFKNKLIAKVLPTVLLVSKTVVEITKLKNGHLVFTTCALYWSSGETVKKIPYAELQPEYLGTRMTVSGTAFVYAPPGKDLIEIVDFGLDVESLEGLLTVIHKAGEYAETDRLINFQDLPLAIQLTYMQLLANVVRESGNSLHEVYRLVVQYGLHEHWNHISAELNLSFEQAFRDYTKQIPYPHEEAITINLLKDICAVYQYTKDSDVLMSREKKYFPLIFSGSTTDRDAIIHYAQMEKKVIEKQINALNVLSAGSAFSVATGAVGTSVFGFSGEMAQVMSILLLNFIPGIGPLISASVGRDVVLKKQLSEAETRQRLREKVMESYGKAEKLAKEQGLAEFSDLLQEEAVKIADRIGFRYTGYTLDEKCVLNHLQTKITGFLNKYQKFFYEGKGTSIKLLQDLSMEEREKVLSNFAIYSSNVNYDDIIGTIFEDFGEILFMSDCIYIHQKESSYVQKMSYFNMLKIKRKWNSAIVLGHNGDILTLDKGLLTLPVLLLLLQGIIDTVTKNK